MAQISAEQEGVPTSSSQRPRFPLAVPPFWWPTVATCQAILTDRFVVQIATVFLAYLVAGKLGQETANIRSGNLGPVWPAYGVALAAFLAYGYRIWVAVAASAFLVAVLSPVPPLVAAGQAAGATLAAATGAFLLRGIADFDCSVSRLRDALALIVLGAFGSAIVSASIGVSVLYSGGLQAYSGLTEAWTIYWFGDATGVLLVTPLVFTLPRLFDIRSQRRPIELAALLTLLTAACMYVFSDLPPVSSRLQALAVTVPFVMWAAIDYGTAGASLSVFVIATIATLLTALGHGAYASSTPFVNAALLDVLFTLLATIGLTLAAVLSERKQAEADRERLAREQAALDIQLRLAAIVESSDEAIVSMTLDGVILSWNAAAERIFGFTEAETIGQSTAILTPPELQNEQRDLLQRLRAGERTQHWETVCVTKTGERLNVSSTISPLRDRHGRLVGAAKILRDITRQKRAEEGLSSLSRRLIEAQDQERRRIARELHDDISQRLAMLAIGLTGLAKGSVISPEVYSEMIALEEQAAALAADVQALSRALHSTKIEMLGLAAAARQFCAEFADQLDVTVDLDVHDLPEQLPPEVSLCLFRILQEALHNSAKHSGVKRFVVRLWGADDEIHLLVSDDGRGFDVEAASAGLGIGLVTMKERLKLVDGDISIDSQPQRGTTVRARVRVGASGSPSHGESPVLSG